MIIHNPFHSSYMTLTLVVHAMQLTCFLPKCPRYFGMHALLRSATSAPWYVSNLQLHPDLGVSYLAEHVRSIAQSLLYVSRCGEPYGSATWEVFTLRSKYTDAIGYVKDSKNDKKNRERERDSQGFCTWNVLNIMLLWICFAVFQNEQSIIIVRACFKLVCVKKAYLR